MKKIKLDPTKTRALVLERTTVRPLNTGDLSRVGGGFPTAGITGDSEKARAGTGCTSLPTC